LTHTLYSEQPLIKISGIICYAESKLFHLGSTTKANVN